jgi:hypothetical protein
MKNRSETWFVCIAVAAASTVLNLGCAKPRNQIITGHDTPIVVQGGSLWIWSTVNFLVPSSTGNVSDFQYVLPANDQYVDTFTAYSDQFLTTKVGSIGIKGGTPWTLCANPHDLKIWSRNTAMGADVINFASAVPNNGLPIFWPMQFGRGSGSYGFGRHHVNPDALTSLNLTTDPTYACPSGTLTSCFKAAATPPCMIPCGKPPCFIQLNY